MILKMQYWVSHVVKDFESALAAYERVFGWKPAYHYALPPDAGYRGAMLPIGPMPGGFSMAGHGLTLTSPTEPNPVPAFEHIFRHRGEGYGFISFHCDEYGPELERLEAMGIDLTAASLHLVRKEVPEHWLTEEHTHGLFVEYGGGGGASEIFFSQGFVKNEIEPATIPERGFILRLGHIVHAVHHLDTALGTYLRLFRLTATHRWDLEDAGVDSAFVRIGERGIQLVQPTGDAGPVSQTMEEIGEGIAYAILMTDDIAACAALLRSRGVDVIEATVGGKPVLWVPRHYTQGLMYQVMEPEDYFSFFAWGKLY